MIEPLAHVPDALQPSVVLVLSWASDSDWVYMSYRLPKDMDPMQCLGRRPEYSQYARTPLCPFLIWLAAHRSQCN